MSTPPPPAPAPPRHAAVGRGKASCRRIGGGGGRRGCRRAATFPEERRRRRRRRRTRSVAAEEKPGAARGRAHASRPPATIRCSCGWCRRRPRARGDRGDFDGRASQIKRLTAARSQDETATHIARRAMPVVTVVAITGTRWIGTWAERELRLERADEGDGGLRDRRDREGDLRVAHLEERRVAEDEDAHEAGEGQRRSSHALRRAREEELGDEQELEAEERVEMILCCDCAPSRCAPPRATRAAGFDETRRLIEPRLQQPLGARRRAGERRRAAGSCAARRPTFRRERGRGRAESENEGRAEAFLDRRSSGVRAVMVRRCCAARAAPRAAPSLAQYQRSGLGDGRRAASCRRPSTQSDVPTSSDPRPRGAAGRGAAGHAASVPSSSISAQMHWT